MTVQVCSQCGFSLDDALNEASGLAALAWVRTNDHGRTTTQCTLCTRANIRAIEAHLDQEAWSTAR
ncbi:MAG: hypothetical protein WCI29_05045 [Actinomycetes bacterium]|jgi:hypothetical protein